MVAGLPAAALRGLPGNGQDEAQAEELGETAEGVQGRRVLSDFQARHLVATAYNLVRLARLVMQPNLAQAA